MTKIAFFEVKEEWERKIIEDNFKSDELKVF